MGRRCSPWKGLAGRPCLSQGDGPGSSVDGTGKAGCHATLAVTTHGTGRITSAHPTTGPAVAASAARAARAATSACRLVTSPYKVGSRERLSGANIEVTTGVRLHTGKGRMLTAPHPAVMLLCTTTSATGRWGCASTTTHLHLHVKRLQCCQGGRRNTHIREPAPPRVRPRL